MAKKTNKDQQEEQTQQNEVLAAGEDSGDLAAADPVDEEEEEEDEDDGYVDPEQIAQDNEEYLNQFIEDLEKAALKDSTIERHLRNVDVFLNNWLAFHEGEPMQSGPMEIDGYLGDWFIRRCMWSTPSNIKTTAASIKKFYKSMLDRGNISKVSYQLLLDSIKTEMAEWQRKCELYNNPYNEWDDIADEFGFF